MQSEKIVRLLVIIAVTSIHIILLLFFAVNLKAGSQAELENARVMKVTDIEEEIPPPPPEEEQLPMVESIAETMIETETEPMQMIVAPGTLTAPSIVPSWDDYLPMHKISEAPKFDEREITSSLVFPPIALRSGIEGRVILELFVDKNGMVQRIRVLQENPKDRGFGEAAVRAFTGKHCVPAMANGEPVSARFRYPVSFTIK